MRVNAGSNPCTRPPPVDPLRKRIRKTVFRGIAFVVSLAMLQANAAGIEASPGGPGADTVRYAVSIDRGGDQQVEVTAIFPVDQASTILYMPIWTPGYYVREDHKANVVAIQAQDGAGRKLDVVDQGANRWSVRTGKARQLVVRYLLSAKGRSVSLNEVAGNYAVLNGSATYIAAKGREALPQAVTLEVPSGWRSATGLRPGKAAGLFLADDYEELVDSPIMLGDLEILEFESAGTPHVVAYNRGAVEVDGGKVIADLKAMTDATRAFWGEKPWRRYAFLLAFRKAGGGLEHRHSTFVNVDPVRFATPAGYGAFVSLLAHEYQHAFNVKRLRPLELGPFDYEATPSVTTLWVSEGLTSYYSNLMLRHSGLINVPTYLGKLSRQITDLQNSPGRLKQSIEQSSMGVWSNSLSGVGASDDTVSYYIKGEVAGFLLDAHLRRVTDGRKSLDDAIRLAYQRYSGKSGFRPQEFSAVVEEVAGRPLSDWFHAVIGTASELDYAEALDWYGLRLERAPGGERVQWTLSVSDTASATQKARLAAWLGNDAMSATVAR